MRFNFDKNDGRKSGKRKKRFIMSDFSIFHNVFLSFLQQLFQISLQPRENQERGISNQYKLGILAIKRFPRLTICYSINRLVIQVTKYSEKQINYIHSCVPTFVRFALSNVTDQRLIIHTSVGSVYITMKTDALDFIDDRLFVQC